MFACTGVGGLVGAPLILKRISMAHCAPAARPLAAVEQVPLRPGKLLPENSKLLLLGPLMLPDSVVACAPEFETYRTCVTSVPQVPKSNGGPLPPPPQFWQSVILTTAASVSVAVSWRDTDGAV